MAPTLRFLGGAGTVTGSKFLLRAAGVTLLVEAGLFQGLRRLRRRNWEPFPVDPATLEAVVLTHAHLDHCGYLRALGRQGLRDPVLATRFTVALAELVLRDSAKLQEEDAAFAARGGWSKHGRPLPLYDSTDVDRVLPLMREAPWSSSPARVCSSAVTSAGPGTRCWSTPLPPPAADVVVVESTYGARQLKMHGRYVRVRADVEVVDGFSVHAAVIPEDGEVVRLG